MKQEAPPAKLKVKLRKPVNPRKLQVNPLELVQPSTGFDEEEDRKDFSSDFLQRMKANLELQFPGTSSGSSFAPPNFSHFNPQNFLEIQKNILALRNNAADQSDDEEEEVQIKVEPDIL